RRRKRDWRQAAGNRGAVWASPPQRPATRRGCVTPAGRAYRLGRAPPEEYRMHALRLAGLFALLVSPALAEAPVVHFAGHDWLVRTYGGAPGPNEWRAANVSVDDA